MKKRLTVFGVFVALAAFSLVSVAAASAHGFGGSSERLNRVAEILGVSPEELSSAVEQAHSEARAERLEQRLVTGVEDGVITAEEADAIRDWFNGKPEALAELSRSERWDIRRAYHEDALAGFLAELVTEEVLTQDESDEIASWFDSRPSDAMERLRDEYGRKVHHGRFKHGLFGGHRGFHGFAPSTPSEPAPENGVATAVQLF